jgi:hypothetical protein
MQLRIRRCETECDAIGKVNSYFEGQVADDDKRMCTVYSGACQMRVSWSPSKLFLQRRSHSASIPRSNQLPRGGHAWLIAGTSSVQCTVQDDLRASHTGALCRAAARRESVGDTSDFTSMQSSHQRSALLRDGESLSLGIAVGDKRTPSAYQS